MEEKKVIKVKLSTVIILFLILIIVGASALLYLKSVKMNNTNDEIVNNTILKNNLANQMEDEKNEENSNLKGEKLIQFDTEFFKLEDVALFAKNCEVMENSATYTYDLNGDGSKEQITIEKNENGNIFKLNGIEFYENYVFDFYIVDLNENDETLEVIITTYAGSDRSEYMVFSKIGDKMEQHETNMSGITGEFMLDRKGKIVSNKFASSLKPSVYNIYYVFENGKITENKLDVNDIKDVNFEIAYNSNYYFSKEADNLFQIEDYLDGGDVVENDLIQKINGKFKILDFDYKDSRIIPVELENGEKGYITTGYGIFIY